jgi:hypothetical protein
MSIANKADQIQDNNFISEYAKLPEVKLLFFILLFLFVSLITLLKKSKVTMRFFDRGDYFCAHGKFWLFFLFQ